VDEKMVPLVSVVIPTKNSENTLELCLESVRAQSYTNIEIIVVDNYSTDSTQEIAMRYGKVYIKGPERSVQKNWGARVAQGKYVVFLDSDAEMSHEVVAACVEKSETGFDAVIIPEQHVGEGFWSRAKAVERMCYLGDDTVESPWFFRRETFLTLNGYDDDLIAAEDYDLFLRLQDCGNSYTRCEPFIHHHLGKLSFISNLRKKFYYGHTLRPYFKKAPFSKTVHQIPFLRTAYIRNWRLLLNHPLSTIGLFLLKFSDTLSIATGMFVSWLGDHHKWWQKWNR